ncbi:hypothetical protein MBSD_n0991 [Mizugakiibacter sediminis]|uniref:Porin n=1 Tax=Mizugakiibacter sediminis TaxID=1475481 RepID=A0A0K8QLA2_9GAMM|nr:hypothetical protein [Mizugakiibacter sediminis]GAP65700.1 hypothetical protein MBSD_n0991 [Mizugakiibacter sediminis]
MQQTGTIVRRAALALAVAAALGAPMIAGAATQTETQLQARIAQLEKELAELKAMVQQQAQSQADLQARQQAQAEAQQRAQAEAQAAAAKQLPTATFSTAPGISVAFHGFVDATAFSQDKTFIFGNGQNAEFPSPGADGSLSGIDIRNTRFWFDFKGAEFTGNWTGGGRIEADFFGGFNGTGAYSRQQPTPRLRQAYMDLVNAQSGSTVRIGQQWDLMFPLDNVPASLTHVAFPLGYGTGIIGWRFPGAVWMQDLNHGSAGTKWRLDLGAFDGNWSGPGDNTNFLTGGNVDFKPQLEARLRAQGANWIAYLAGHYSQIDLRGVGGTASAPVKRNIDSVGYEIGGVWKPGDWVFRGLLFGGKGIGQIFGALAQFGDIQETGGFVQAGYNFTPHWSAYAFYAMDKPDRNDVIAWLGNGSSGRLKNRQAALSLQYAAGAYELGVEWVYDKLDSTRDGVTTTKTDGNQFSLSAMYHF